MKTGLDMVNDAFGILNVPDITTVITGNLYKLARPKNSKVEDIVINALPLTAEQLQKGVFNVNIHVPNLKNVVIGGVTDETQPDVTRLGQIGKIVVEKLRDVVGNDFHFNADNSGYPIKDEDDTWYLNVRVSYYAVQTNFTNV